jgi:hypothetical protein
MPFKFTLILLNRSFKHPSLHFNTICITWGTQFYCIFFLKTGMEKELYHLEDSWTVKLTAVSQRNDNAYEVTGVLSCTAATDSTWVGSMV